MKRPVNIAVIGDYDENKVSHPATDAAIQHAADSLAIEVSAVWLPTPDFLTAGGADMARFNAVWASSGSPYRSMEGTLEGIRLARESGRPFIGI